MNIGILAVQGAFIEHSNMLKKLGVSSMEIRCSNDLDNLFDGLIIPGGESTVQGKLLKELGMFDKLKSMIEGGLPVFGTCAGLILLAKQIDNDSRTHLATMNTNVVRNAYGRQLGSFYTEEEFADIGKIPMTFIRAPYIKSVGDDVVVLAEAEGNIVAARQGNQLVTAFHPELNSDTRVHSYFIDMVKNSGRTAF